MDAQQFDALTRSLTALGTRRGLLTVLSTLPVVAGLRAALDPLEAAAYPRRKRRKRRHQHHGKQHRKGKRKGQGNNKTKTADCDGIACQACETCQNNVCSAPCNGAGCCAGDSCAPGTEDSACGSGGATCVACSGPTPVCVGGSCAPCSAANPCPSGCCDTTTGACVTSCPTCQTCSSGICQGVPNNTVACDGSPLARDESGDLCAFDGVGICADGACSCGSQIHDPTDSNRCLCGQEFAAACAADPSNKCCAVGEVCVDGEVGGCFPCS